MTPANQNYPQKPRALQPRTRPLEPSPFQTSFAWLDDKPPANAPPTVPFEPKPEPTPAPPPTQPRPAAALCAVAAAAAVFLIFASAPRASALSLPNALRNDTQAAAARGQLDRPQQRIAARQQAFLECHLEFGCRLDWLTNRRDARAARRQGNAAPAAPAPQEPPRPFRAFLLRMRYPLADHDPPTRIQELRRRRRADRRHSNANDMAPPPDETAPTAPPAGPRPY